MPRVKSQRIFAARLVEVIEAHLGPVGKRHALESRTILDLPRGRGGGRSSAKAADAAVLGEAFDEPAGHDLAFQGHAGGGVVVIAIYGDPHRVAVAVEGMESL